MPPQRIIGGPSCARDRHDVVAPLIAQVIPGRLDGTICCTQRFHELHIEIGRQFEQRLRIYQDGTAVLRLGLEGFRRCNPNRSGGGNTGRRDGGFF